MKLYRIYDNATVEVADADAPTLLQSKNANGEPLYRASTDADSLPAVTAAKQRDADTSALPRIKNVANQLAGSMTLGIVKDTSAEANRIASANETDTLVSNVAGMFTPGGLESVLAKGVSRAFSVGKTVKAIEGVAGVAKAATAAPSVIKAGIETAATISASALANNTVIAIRKGGDFRGVLDGVSPLSLPTGVGSLAAMLLTRRANGMAAKAGRLEAAVAGVKAAEEGLAKAVAGGATKADELAKLESSLTAAKAKVSEIKSKKAPTVEDEGVKGINKIDVDVYDGMRAPLQKATDNLKHGNEALKDTETQYRNAQRMQADVPAAKERYRQDKAAHDAKELKRQAAVTSGEVQAANDAEFVAQNLKDDAARKELYKRYATEQKIVEPPTPRKVKGQPAPEPAGIPAEQAEGFDRFLISTGNGHLSKDALGVESLADRFMSHVVSLGDDIPTDKVGMSKLWDDFIDGEGYAATKALPGRKANSSVAGGNTYDGWYPESNLRPLDPSEASRTYPFKGEIGQAGIRDMVLNAEQARVITPSRAIELMADMTDDAKRAFLMTMGPEARAQTMLHIAGKIRHPENVVLQSHKLRTTANSERSARFRYELEDAFTETLTPKLTSEVRAPISRPRKLQPEDLNPELRPYPLAPPIEDFSAQVAELGVKYEDIQGVVKALEGLRLPKTAKGFATMGSAEFDRMAEGVRKLKIHADPDIANVAREVEEAAHDALTKLGVDVPAMVESEGDIMGVLNNVRKELRDHPARLAEHGKALATERAVKKAEFEAAKGADVAKAQGEAAGLKTNFDAAKSGMKKAQGVEVKAAAAELKSAQQVAGANGGLAKGGVMQQAGGIFGRYMGSKALMGAAAALGFSGNGVMSAVGFALGGAAGGAAGKRALGRSNKIMAIEAMISKAERGLKIAEVIRGVSKHATRAAIGVNNAERSLGGSAFGKIFEYKEQDFDAFFPEGDRPTSDSEAIMQLSVKHASALADPASAGYRSVGDMTITNPNLAQGMAADITTKIHVLANELPPVPPNGFTSQAGQYPLLHPERIDRVKRVCSVLLHPTQCLARMIENARFPQAELDIIRETNPDMYAEVAMSLMDELYTEDESGRTVLSQMPLNKQLEFARALGIDSLPGSSPGYVAAMQRSNAESHQPKPNSMAKPLSSGQGIRAPGPDSSNATESQRSTY